MQQGRAEDPLLQPVLEQTHMLSCFYVLLCYLGQEDPWRRAWLPTPVFLPEKSPGQRSLVGYSSWDCEGSDTTEHPHDHLSLRK